MGQRNGLPVWRQEPSKNANNLGLFIWYSSGDNGGWFLSHGVDEVTSASMNRHYAKHRVRLCVCACACVHARACVWVCVCVFVFARGVLASAHSAI